ncbi:MAG: FtsK/SpoIIIE domain-containing protein [bacterium]
MNDAVKLYFQGLHPECVVATISLIQRDPVLRPLVEVHLSRKVFSDSAVPEELLTDHAVGDYRNEEPEAEKKLMLLGPPDESEWDTVRMMQSFGEQEIMDADEAWVDAFAPPIMDATHKAWWRAALRGLNSLAFARLSEFADFVARTSTLVHQNGLLPEALGNSLPALRLPRRADLFSIGEKQRGQTSRWKRKFNDHKRSAQCFLTKRDRSETLLDNDMLAAAVREYREQDDCDPAVAATFDEYVAADYGWSAASAKIAEIDWSIVNPALFERIKASKKQNLGEETLTLFESEAKLRDLLDEEKECLKQLAELGAKGGASPQDKAFFRRYYRELQTSPPLFSRWEGFILERSVEDTDFLNGLARCLRLLRPRTTGKAWKLVVRAKASKDKDLYLVNEATGTYFATCYQGLPPLLSKSVEFHGMRILDYPQLLAAWRKDKLTKRRLKESSISRDACQLVFYVELQSDTQRQIKLVWRFNPKSIAANQRSDMERLATAKNPVVCTAVRRETSGRRSLPLDLRNVLCLQPVFGRTSGSLVPQTEKLKNHSVRGQVIASLHYLVGTKSLSKADQQALLAVFDEFEDSYRAALQAFLSKGLAADKEVGKAAEAYGRLLGLAASAHFPDTVWGTVLPVLLSASTIRVESFGPEARSTAIVPPWHPLRLQAITAKARQFAQLAEDLTTGAKTLSDADGDLFFEDTAEWLGHIYYPEIVCQLRGKQPEILAHCEHHQNYSVHEPPVKSGDEDVSTDTDPKAAAAQIGAIVESYLELQPHERDNLSVVLFDCDSELLPGAVVEEIRNLSEDEEQDAMCQILLAHSDGGKLRALYRSLARVTESSDSFNTSEATREFMARLRINIMVSEDGSWRSQDGHPYDIVFAESTIARHAKLEWDMVPVDNRPAHKVRPSAWSRRKPMRCGAISAAVYLTSPTGPESAWLYLKAIAHAREPEKARGVPDGQCLIPTRSLGLHEESIAQLIDKMHSLGNWVVNFDELLHRKLLENQGIKIIRYKRTSTQGRHLIISSKAKDSMLRNALQQLASKLLPEIDSQRMESLVDDLLTEANTISGNLVLRAVRRTENAKELLGLVLSKYLVSTELGTERHFGWFLLDDYASWLGEEEKQIADILCLSPGIDQGGSPVLDIVVTEVKFVEHAAITKKAKESAGQLRQTLDRLERGLGTAEKCLDREIWLARISDMIVDGIEAYAVDDFDASKWRRMVRDGLCGIRIRGYSHVFDHGTEQPNATYEPVSVENTQNGYQELFSLNQTRALLKSFLDKKQPERRIPGTVVSGSRQNSAVPQQSVPFAEDSTLPVEAGNNTSTGVAALTAELSDSERPTPVEQRESFTQADPLLQFLEAYPEPQEADARTLAWVAETNIAARKALVGYEMPAELVSPPLLTPNSLLLKFKGSDKLTSAALERKRTELYTTHGLKVVNVRPEAGAVAISIERPERQIISIGSVWKRWCPEITPQGNTRILVALKEDDSTPLFLDPLTQSPHTLIAGTSGSGKSVLLQNILLGIAATNAPDVAKVVLIDPKHGVDYGPLGNLPHIDGGIITKPDEALVAIEHLVEEMESRYPRLNSASVNHVQLFNQQNTEKMPLIWLIHDEFADWMQNEDYRREVVSLVNRLGMKARAAGIFLIFAAQRPSVEVMPMQLRDNLDNRLILRVAQEGTSMFCLGEKGAESLLSRGQILARLGGAESLLCQVPFANLEEFRSLCQAVTERHVQ